MVDIGKGFLYQRVPIEELSQDLRLQRLVSCRFCDDIVQLHKILNGKADCPQMVLIKTPLSTRSNNLCQATPQLLCSMQYDDPISQIWKQCYQGFYFSKDSIANPQDYDSCTTSAATMLLVAFGFYPC